MKQETKESMIVLGTAAAIAAVLLLTGCSTTIYNFGDDARFELSPARNLYPNTSVMNGLSLVPKSSSSEDTSKSDVGEKTEKKEAEDK